MKFPFNFGVLFNLIRSIMDKKFLMKEIDRLEKTIARKKQEVVDHQAHLEFLQKQVDLTDSKPAK